MEDHSSEQVVIPDMTDPLANKSESNENETSEAHGPHSTVSVTPVEGVSVSSPVPVASLINVSAGGASFNVITPEQLQVKCMVFVDRLDNASIFLYLVDLRIPLFLFMISKI